MPVKECNACTGSDTTQGVCIPCLLGDWCPAGTVNKCVFSFSFMIQAHIDEICRYCGVCGAKCNWFFDVMFDHRILSKRLFGMLLLDSL